MVKGSSCATFRTESCLSDNSGDGCHQAFVADEDDITELSNVLIKRLGKLEIEAVCVDQTTRVFDTTEELLQYQNTPSKAIESLTLKAYKGDNIFWRISQRPFRCWELDTRDFNRRPCSFHSNLRFTFKSPTCQRGQTLFFVLQCLKVAHSVTFPARRCRCPGSHERPRHQLWQP